MKSCTIRFLLVCCLVAFPLVAQQDSGLGRSAAGRPSSGTSKPQPLALKAQADSEVLAMATKTTLRASAEGGQPPYTFSWSGGVVAKGESVEFQAPRKPGRVTVFATVRDSIGREEVATVALEVRAAVLQVDISADVAELIIGQSAKLTGTAKGGRPPFRYQWKGGASGQAQTAELQATEVGTREAQLTITDARGLMGAKRIALNVKPLQARFARHPAEVNFGEALPLAVDLPSGNWMAVFHSSPEVPFTPAQAADGRTSVSVRQRSAFRVWADLLKDGKPAGAVAEDSIEVRLPQVALTFAPLKVGLNEEVTASVRITPSLDSSLYRLEWKTLPPGASQAGPDRVVFSAKDFNPIELSVSAVSSQGEPLAETSGKFAATPLTLKAEIGGPIGPFPKLMRNGQLVDVTDIYAVNERVRVSSFFEPKPVEGAQLQWSLSKGCLTDSSKNSPEIIVYRTTAGDCGLTVIAKIKKEKIAEASLHVPITLTPADLDQAKVEKAKADAGVMLQQAEKYAVAKQFETARLIIDEAQKYDPEKARAYRERISTMAAAPADQALAALDFMTALSHIDQAIRINSANREMVARRFQVIAWEQDWQRAQALGHQFRSLLGARRLPSAEVVLEQVRDLVRPIPSPALTEWYNGMAKQASGARPEYLAYLEPYRKRIQEQLQARAFKQALASCQQVLQRELYPAHEKEIRDWMQQARDGLGSAASRP